jgi:hypothetical protein
MGISFSILLLAIGAILAFAVRSTTYLGVDVHVVGWILMGAGLLGLVWSLVLTMTRRRTVVLEPRNDAVTRVVERDLPAERDVPVQRAVPVDRETRADDPVRRESR